ncbi:hypothetical protein ACJQWK_07677 [Exserohilum turcicum]
MRLVSIAGRQPTPSAMAMQRHGMLARHVVIAQDWVSLQPQPRGECPVGHTAALLGGKNALPIAHGCRSAPSAFTSNVATHGRSDKVAPWTCSVSPPALVFCLCGMRP